MFFGLFPILLSSQNKFDQYLMRMNDSRKLFYEKEYEKAIISYNSIENEFEEYLVYYFYFERANIYNSIGDLNSSLIDLKKAITFGATQEHFEQGYIVGDSLGKLAWEKFKNDYLLLRKEYFNKLNNIDAYLQTEQLIVKDQMIRQLANQNNCISDSIIASIDDSNIVELIKIIKKFGWQKNCWALLWHHRDTYKQKGSIWDELIPIINNEIKNGKLPTSYLVMFEDNLSLEKNGKTKYGTLMMTPVVEDVNLNRSQVFLPPLTKNDIEILNSN